MASKRPPIAIIGAGISGLTLSLALKSKGIASVIFDRAKPTPRNNHGITLAPSTYRPLLALLNLDEITLIEKLAVDRGQGGNGRLQGGGGSSNNSGFKCHRGRLETLLAGGLDIRWEKKLKDVKLGSNGDKGVIAIFEDGSEHQTTCLVGCDGVHSVVRKSLAWNSGSSSELQVLPYVVFNGKRRVSIEDYKTRIAPYMDGCVQKRMRSGSVLLEIAVANMTESRVDLSYTYSRRAREDGDSLHNPGRDTGGASEVPEAFYEELGKLEGLERPFGEVFDAKQAREDRTLHWLMRVLDTKAQAETTERASKHGLLLIGDAVHPTPIFGGNGAQLAIQDGLDLADYIVNNGTDDLGNFTELRLPVWMTSVQDSKARIAEMHSSSASHL